MAKPGFSYPIDSVQGKLNKKDRSGTVFRQKHYYDENGNIIGESDTEAFVVEHPRDYEKNPPKGAELANITAFQQAALRVKEELANQERCAYWRARWHNQLQKGEQEAPIDPKTHEHRIYMRFDKFVLAALLCECRPEKV